MKKILFIPIFLLLTNNAFSQISEALIVKEYKLKNGLTVWINEDHSTQKVYGSVVVKAGAKDSPDTGIAHYFEHIMFKGTDKIGTTDYAAEKVYLDSISLKYDELAATTDAIRRKAIQKEINELSIKAAEYAIPNELDRLISCYGGSGLNAFTNYDLTVYHNTFSPQYFGQWATLYSERFVDPVFRLFQSELETVYEEKNMYDDALIRKTQQVLFRKFFAPHPYMYSVIGSGENLKNPQLSEMKKFYDQYYVAGNMGLIICGDVYADDIMPVIERTFGRIQAGEAPKKDIPQPASINGRETFKVKIPIPLVKAGAYGWRGAPQYHEDEMALEIATGLLNNSNMSGFLDKLTNDRKILGAGIMNIGYYDAGLLAGFVVPKLLFQSESKAKKLMYAEIERLKTGDFTEEDVDASKIEIKRNYQRSLESLDDRAYMMQSIFGKGKSWNEHLDRIMTIDRYGKSDIMAIANKYFTGNYFDVSKKTGNYPKERVEKPGFAPIVPKNKDAESTYAKELEKLPLTDAHPRFLDFEKEVETVDIAPLVHLYMKQNPINDIFSIKISFGKGSNESNLLAPLRAYLELLGTESMNYDEFRNSFQRLGAIFYTNCGLNDFSLNLTGFDRHFEESMALMAQFIRQVKPEKKKLKQLVDEKKLVDKSFDQSPDNLATALFQKVAYGQNSDFLKQLSLAETKKLTTDDLMQAFADILSVECDIHYSGKLPAETVVEQLKKTLNTANVTTPSNVPLFFEKSEYHEPLVYFVDSPKATQSIIRLYCLGGVNEDEGSRHAGDLFTSYFGSGMSSIIFQEIREFRSLAYRAAAGYSFTNYKHRDKPGFFYGILSTQSDKTIEAMTVIDSLIRHFPVKPERVESARQRIINNAMNTYPEFRQVSSRIASLKKQGYSDDPNKLLTEAMPNMGMDEIVDFYTKNIKGRPTVYLVVGSEKHLDMNRLSEFGKIVKLKLSDIYK
ncbi:MAG: insulinase family protein [Prevotellaceae bacterium]|jgi:predicted Zn-dependent peptidase|nr:insulinase family protein [Prevotellaceae bacterium]